VRGADLGPEPGPRVLIRLWQVQAEDIRKKSKPSPLLSTVR